MPADPAWQHLGQQLLRRRLELDRKYYKRSEFARDKGIDYHVIADLETGRRSNFEVQTVHRIEHAYELPVGVLERAVGLGGDLAAALAVPDEAAGEESEIEVAALRHELEIETLKREMAELRLRLRDLEAQAAGEGRSWQPRRRPAG